MILHTRYFYLYGLINAKYCRGSVFILLDIIFLSERVCALSYVYVAFLLFVQPFATYIVISCCCSRFYFCCCCLCSCCSLLFVVFVNDVVVVHVIIIIIILDNNYNIIVIIVLMVDWSGILSIFFEILYLCFDIFVASRDCQMELQLENCLRCGFLGMKEN